MKLSSLCRLSLVLVCGVVIGCGSSVKGVDPNLVPVTGKVTIDGKPLTKGDISFLSSEGKAFSGTIDATGSYALAYSLSAKGALPGDYTVRVESLEGTPSMGAGGQVTPAKSVIPEKYNKPTTSGLTAKVEKGKSNVFNFDLKSQ